MFRSLGRATQRLKRPLASRYMFQLHFPSLASRAVVLFIAFAPPFFLGVGAFRAVIRRKWTTALIFLIVLAGWLARTAIEQHVGPLNLNKLPLDLYIAQPTSSSLNDPLILVVKDRAVLKLQAPSEMSWSLRGTERELCFDYGYVPQAYEEGSPNGAEVIVELSEGPNIRRVFQRSVLPLSRPADRQMLSSRVILPPFNPGSRLVLRFGPGENNDNAWDWLYLVNLKFRESAGFLPSQFPSFKTLPTEAEAPLGYLYQKDGRSQFLQLDAPSHLNYRLKGSERRLSFSYGILPGAYRNGGNTDGVEFRVEIQWSGETSLVLFERLLRPSTLASDRGRQYLDLSLPATRAGAQLILTIGPGPAQNNSWDWSYIRQVTLE